MKAYNLSVNNYQFTLIDFTQPLYHIRLKLVDNDDRFKYSGIIRIMINAKLVNIETVLLNPVTDVLNLRIMSTVSAGGNVNLINIPGQTVYQQKLSIMKGSNLISINSISNFAKGLYTVRVIVDGEMVVAQVFKQ